MIYNDPRYLDLGELPSRFKYYDFKNILARPFILHDLPPLSMALNLKSIRMLCRVISNTLNIDAEDLIDADFIYVEGWLKLHSFPKAPTTLKWTCQNTTYKDRYGNNVNQRIASTLSPEALKAKGIKSDFCGSKRVYIAHQSRLKTTLIKPNFELPEGLAFPTVKTLIELEDAEDDPRFTHLGHALRWIAGGDTLDEKYHYVKKHNQEHLLGVAMHLHKEFMFGLQEISPLECLACGHKHTVTRSLGLFDLLPNHSEQSILTMQDNLINANNAVFSYDTPTRPFLYAHSSLVKRHKEAEQKRAAAKAKGNNRG